LRDTIAYLIDSIHDFFIEKAGIFPALYTTLTQQKQKLLDTENNKALSSLRVMSGLLKNNVDY